MPVMRWQRQSPNVLRSFQFDPAVPGLVWIDVHDLGCSAFVRRLLRSMKLLQRHSVLPSLLLEHTARIILLEPGETKNDVPRQTPPMDERFIN